MGRNTEAARGFRGASRLLRRVGEHSADKQAVTWLAQAQRLLASADMPTGSATVRPTPNGPLISVELPPETAGIVLDWALEAAARVLRGDPQPPEAEVYKAARAILS